MADPVKPLDRTRPFKRINNEAFRPQAKPDGDGVRCGCRTFAQFGDPGKEFDEFIQDNVPIAGPVLRAVDLIRKILDPVELAKLLFEGLRKELPDALAAAFTAAALILVAPFLLVLAPIKIFLDKVAGVIHGVLNTFAGVLARRVLRRAVRVIPQWVPVKQGASNKSVNREQIVEVEGICTRSFGNPVDVPFLNWHRWFSWNVQVQPEPEYLNVLSQAPDPPNTQGMTGSEQSIIKSGSFEIQWDAGALFDKGGRDAFTPGFASREMPLHDGPMITPVSNPEVGTLIQSDFLWPMAGLFVWASGRHVYDCSRVTDPRDDATDPRMCAMIHPARAIATARFTAATFIENGDFSVPAIEFMFLASSRGGYIDHEAMADGDYEFIIDLPPIDLDLTPFPIGNTEHFPQNTIQLRPRLLKDLRFMPGIGSTEGDPIIETIRPDDPTKAPSQVKLTIPKSVFTGDAYGFKLALGWFDPDRAQARKVKLCTITLKSLQFRLTDRDAPGEKLRAIFKQEEDGLKREIIRQLDEISVDIPIVGKIHPMRIPVVGDKVKEAVATVLEFFISELVKLVPSEGEEEWLLRIGVNGIWMAGFFTPRLQQTKDFVSMNVRFEFRLPVGDQLLFAVHGTEFDPVGDIMHSSAGNRTMTLRNVPIPWEKIVTPDSKQDYRKIVFDYCLKAMVDTTEGVGKLSLGFDNSPLGLIDPDPANSGFSQQNNPMIVRDNFEPINTQRLSHFARVLDDKEAILVESTGETRTGFPVRPDYDLRYTLEIKDQVKKDAS